MNNNNQQFIISLGGSLIVPGSIDTNFLAKLKQVLENRIKRGQRFILITGGGKTARNYADAARTLHCLNPVDLDWLGIHSTRLNGHLLRTIFRAHAHKRIITNPAHAEPVKEPLAVAAGYRPGWSTDYVAVLLAKKYRIKTILNLTNIDYIYDKNPRKYKSAKPLKQIDWQVFRKLVGNKWDPGLHLPFDPVAARLAEKLKLKVAIIHGHDFVSLHNFLSAKKFKGTIIN